MDMYLKYKNKFESLIELSNKVFDVYNDFLSENSYTMNHSFRSDLVCQSRVFSFPYVIRVYVPPREFDYISFTTKKSKDYFTISVNSFEEIESVLMDMLNNTNKYKTLIKSFELERDIDDVLD